jgi:hypothetical protein
LPDFEDTDKNEIIVLMRNMNWMIRQIERRDTGPRLTISRKLVSIMGRKIRMRSEPGGAGRQGCHYWTIQNPGSKTG